jgi:single-strand DNA-binding protein
MSVNKVILLGRLGKDPEIKYTANGNAVCNFTIATSESWSDKNGQKQERTEWHRIVVWGKLGELCNQYLKKGREAFVEGKLQTRSWDGQDGKKNYTTEILADNVRFIGGAATAGTGATAGRAYNQNDSMNQDMGQNNYNQDQNFEIASDASFASDDIPF